MPEVTERLRKTKVHVSTKFVPVGNKRSAAVEYIYLPPHTVRALGSPDQIELVIRPVPDITSNAAPAANEEHQENEPIEPVA